jgi:3-dehydroquinate synthase
VIEGFDGHPIRVGEDLLGELEQFVQTHFPQHKVFILVDSNTEAHCLEAFHWLESEAFVHCEILSVPAGEESKCLAILEQLAASMLEIGSTRKTLLINLGGGMITDLGGLLATTFKRVIPFIQMPTSLLAMVDASVGGKTGVNVNGVKNQIGTFSFPQAVFCDTQFLKTLPKRELISGFAELVKHALISDVDLWNRLHELDFSEVPSAGLIEKSIAVKNDIVNQDPYEGKERKKLNFGHTAGHAIESWFQQKGQALLHGEAVAMGMLVELFFSRKHAGLAEADFQSAVQFLIQRFGKYHLEASDFMPLIDLMQNDKKNEDLSINFTLLQGIGEAQTDFRLTEVEVEEGLKWYSNL